MKNIPPLTEQDKKRLLSLAKKAVKDYLLRGTIEPPDKLSDYKPFGVFVTIKKHGELRGCIGTFDSKPIEIMVQESAISSAFNDPRFPPVRKDELDLLKFEISILTPYERVKKLDEIVPGKHGLIVEKHLHRGLLLPQVASEYGWDRETFLMYTCAKAGLPMDCWKDPETKIYKFEALVFGEDE